MIDRCLDVYSIVSKAYLKPLGVLHQGIEHVGRSDTYSIGIMSLIMMLPINKVPPAPIPQTALAAMRLSILVAREHHSVAAEKIAMVPRKSGFLPNASDRRLRKGCETVVIIMKAVESQDAELAASKYDVIIGWEDAIMVVSKKQRNCVVSICENIVQNCAVDKPARNGDGLLRVVVWYPRAVAGSCGRRRLRVSSSLEIGSAVLLWLPMPTKWASFISLFLIHFAMTMTDADCFGMPRSSPKTTIFKTTQSKISRNTNFLIKNKGLEQLTSAVLQHQWRGCSTWCGGSLTLHDFISEPLSPTQLSQT